MMPYSYTYTIPYVISFLFLFILSLLDVRDVDKGIVDNKWRMLCFIYLLVFFGLRGFIATDWISYYNLFSELPTFYGQTKVSFDDFYMEPGFILYSILFKTLIPDYHCWVFVSTFIDLYLLNVVFKKHLKYYVLAFLFYYCFCFLVEVNLYRNIKGILLFVVSIKYASEEKICKYMLLNILGCFFHLSSILYLFVYPFLRWNIPKKMLWVIFLVGNVIFVFHIEWSLPLINFIGDNIGIERAVSIIRYADKATPSFLSIGYIERCFTFLLICFMYNKIILNNSYNRAVFNCYVLYFVFLFFFSEFKIIADRLSTLFVFSYCFVYPLLFERLKVRRGVFLLLLLVYGLTRQVSGYTHIMSKYSNLIWGIDSFEERSYDFYRYYSD